MSTGRLTAFPRLIHLPSPGESSNLPVFPPIAQTTHSNLCEDLITLIEKVDALDRRRASTESNLKEIRDVISQVKLFMALSIGGGGLSIFTLTATMIRRIK